MFQLLGMVAEAEEELITIIAMVIREMIKNRLCHLNKEEITIIVAVMINLKN